MKAFWKRWGWLIRWCGTALGVAYIAFVIDWDKIEDGLAHVSVLAVVAAVALLTLGVTAGVVRWRALLRAYGATSIPSMWGATRIYFIALFYNSYLPGGLVGDVMRGVVSRESFGEHGTTGALAVVFVERILGLFAMFVLVVSGLLVAGTALGDTHSLWIWCIVGFVVAIVGVLALPFGRKLARILPAPLARIAEKLPVVEGWTAFGNAALLSLVTQLCTAIAGWLLLRDAAANVTFGATLLVVPLAAATAYLPITVSGAGARETVFITLCAHLFDMPSEVALASSLMLWLSVLIVSAIGGVWQLATRNARPTTA